MTYSVVPVPMGRLEVSTDREAVLNTLVGSCVALCICDPSAAVAGMAHVMLPESDHRWVSDPRSAKYADRAVESLVTLLGRRGADRSRTWAKMAGGANMFFHEGGRRMFDIGERNAAAIRELLEGKGIPLVAEDTGGTFGRKVQLFVHSGELVVTSTKRGVRRL